MCGAYPPFFRFTDPYSIPTLIVTTLRQNWHLKSVVAREWGKGMGVSLNAHHLLVAGVVPLAIVIAAVAIVRGGEAGSLRAQAFAQQQQAAIDEAAPLDAAIDVHFDTLTRLRSQLSSLAVLPVAARQLSADDPTVNALFAVSPNGRIQVHGAQRPTALQIPDQELMTWLGGSATAYLSVPVQSNATGTPMIAIAVPWRDAPQQAGLIGLQIDLSDEPALRALTHPATHPGTKRCLHAGGQVLQINARTDGSVRLDPVSDCSPPAPAAAPWLDHLFPVGDVTAYVPLPHTGWMLERTTPAREAFAPFRAAQATLGIVALAILAISLGTAWWLFRLLMQPLRELQRLTALTEPGTRPPPATEITALTDAFRHSLIHLRRRVRLVTHACDHATQVAERATLTADLFPDLAGLIGPDRCFIHVNKPHEALFGKPASAIIGRPVHELWGHESFAEMEPFLTQALQGSAATFTMRHGPPRTARWLETTYQPVLTPETGDVRAVHFRVRDLTTERHNALRLQREVQTDALTGLLNRRGFNFRLERALARTSGDGGAITLMYVDLDRFKEVNDTYGHAVGDELLRTFAQRLTHAVRSNDALGRLGGDEFVILIEGDEAAYTDRVARAVLACAQLSFNLREHWVEIGASIGIASGRGGEKTVHQLSEEADAALYQAKRDGKNCFRRFRISAAA
ncbi:diguanylate cyclase [Imbroritus primus]|uniref:Diguanylate cyclase n=1 Tax=Imbroritus primus TaxID=3058603 RepID=A0ACD3SSR9_9BURK|nr:diguanylate cyclase [Burkholderiaceae bacterium PBA]